MADKEEQKDGAEVEADEQSEPKPGKKKAVVLGGGVLGLVVVAYVASLMAVPAKEEEKVFAGPFVAALSEKKIQVNLMGESGKRFLVMSLNAVFDAYDELYIAERLADSLYMPLVTDALIDIGSQKQREEIVSLADKDVFKEELREAIDPILFPVHCGDSPSPYTADSLSGVAPGESTYESTLRGPLFEHELHVSSPERTVRLDGGEPVTFLGDEGNLKVTNERGAYVFIDVRNLIEDFEGSIPIGVHGRVRRVTFSEFLVQ